jgi:hypothetical protein
MPSPNEPQFGGEFNSFNIAEEIKNNSSLQKLMSLSTGSGLGKTFSKIEKAKFEKLVSFLAKEMLETRFFARGWELATNAQQGRVAGNPTSQSGTGKRQRPEEEERTKIQERMKIQRRAKPPTPSQTIK